PPHLHPHPTTTRRSSDLRVHLCTYAFARPSYDTDRSLHSFPTRRSSDLIPGHKIRSKLHTGILQIHRFRQAAYQQCFGNSWYTRSEEHTSELQSRFDLVCRLLLEKKNVGLQVYRSEEHTSGLQ